MTGHLTPEQERHYMNLGAWHAVVVLFLVWLTWPALPVALRFLELTLR
jgi:hypothetical protein